MTPGPRSTASRLAPSDSCCVAKRRPRPRRNRPRSRRAPSPAAPAARRTPPLPRVVAGNRSRPRAERSCPSIGGVTPELEATLKKLPDRPGVYLMKDARGDVLYVGKAQSLRNRVRSYWQKQATGGGYGEVHR